MEKIWRRQGEEGGEKVKKETENSGQKKKKMQERVKDRESKR